MGKLNVGSYKALWGPSECGATGTLKTYDCLPQLLNIQQPVLLTCSYDDICSPLRLQKALEHLCGGFSTFLKIVLIPLILKNQSFSSKVWMTFSRKKHNELSLWGDLSCSLPLLPLKFQNLALAPSCKAD